MKNFLNLPEDKQNTIIDAAFVTFGTNGYKKSSVSDIATAAGISKPMIFHYFGSKKALYLYLINLAGDILFSEVKSKFDMKVTDFFDRIKLATEIKISVMKRHPAILSFISSAYFETDTEVIAEIKSLMSQGDVFRSHIVFDGLDVSKFKDDVDPQLVMKMLMLFTEGYISKVPVKTEFDIDVILKDFNDCLKLMKNNFYKEEYI